MITDQLLNERLNVPGQLVDVTVDDVTIHGLRPIGSRHWFEYHCNESHDSPDAKVWYHSHQQVTVIGLDCEVLCKTREERDESGHPLVYKVRFDDGLEWGAFEDELLDNPSDFCRPAPPKEKI